MHNAIYSIEEERYICTCKRHKYCLSAGKHPVFSNWQKTPIPTNSKKTINQIQSSKAAFAIATGPLPKDPSTSLIVYDIDLPALEAKDPFISSLPPTLTTRTRSGGLHFYYFIPSSAKINNLSTGYIDVRAEGGYVLAPPSHGYTFTEDSLDKITSLSEPLILPSKSSNPSTLSTHQSINPNLTHDGLVPKGQRDYFVFTRLRQAVQSGYTRAMLDPLCKIIYQQLEQPANDPFTYHEITSKASKVYQDYSDPIAEEMLKLLEEGF